MRENPAVWAWLLLIIMAVTTTPPMTTTYSQPSLDSHPFDLKSALVEPLLVVGVSAFWLVTLPVAAVAMLGVKVGEGVNAFVRGSARANPLILRKGHAAKNETALSTQAAQKKA